METPHNLTDMVLKSRTALTDVSNLPPKRPFSSICGDDGVDNIAKKKCLSQFSSPIPIFSDSSPHDVSYQEPNILLRAASEERDETLGEKAQERAPIDEGFVDLATDSDDRNHYILENSRPTKCVGKPPLYPGPCGSKFLGLERCAGLKSHGGGGGGGDNLGVDAATAAKLLKNCACSFCTKAGHMWSDLHYQDAKSRLTAIRKSQKEARILFQKISGLKDTHAIIHNQQQCPDPSDLESTLTHQWQSLFAFMEDKYTQEIGQRESELLTLRDLKEKCKNDLELTDKGNFDYQQTSGAFCD